MWGTQAEVKQFLADGNTMVDVVKGYLENIKKNENLNAFLEVFESAALERARQLDEKKQNGLPCGQLFGMVVGIKDNLCYKGYRVSAASRILENFESLFSATAIERLESEDAIIIGRLNCDEFAMGSSNETSAFGAVSHHLDSSKIPGGSSGGSAVAVAAKMCTASLGSDTGGSVRQPASFTGTYGLKPSYGRISRHGLIAYASSFDQIGTFTNSIQDAAILLEIMAGKDDFDSTVSSHDVPNYSDLKSPKKRKIALLKESLDTEGLDTEIAQHTHDMVQKMEENGYEVDFVSFPYFSYVVPTYYVLTTAEASSNLSRYDGVHYGYRSDRVLGVEQTYIQSRSEGFGSEVKRRIMSGTFVLSHGYYDAYYTKAQKVRRILHDATQAIFADFDAILLPTTPSTAFEKNGVQDPIQMYLQDIFTVHANLTGHPAISIPTGVHTNGLPFGLQLIAPMFEEKEMLEIAQHIAQL